MNFRNVYDVGMKESIGNFEFEDKWRSGFVSGGGVILETVI